MQGVRMPLPAAAVPVPVIHAAFVQITLSPPQNPSLCLVVAVWVLLVWSEVFPELPFLH